MQEAERAEINEQLKACVLRHTPHAGDNDTAIDGFRLVRFTQPNAMNMLYTPVIGLTLQGFKRSIVAGTEYNFGAYNCLVAGVDMPSSCHVIEASPQKPFLGMCIELDKVLVAQIAAQMPPAPRANDSIHSMAVMQVNTKVMRAFLRLVELLDEPEEIPIMAAMLKREIHHRLLLGPQGPWLRALCALGTPSHQAAQAVTWLRKNYKSPLLVEELAHSVGMSPSSFFRNFKKLTSMSPLQYQKTMRLLEAQRLLLNNECTVSSAAYAVGYESSTQFIREYKRMFGEPPHRDMSRKRAALHAAR